MGAEDAGILAVRFGLEGRVDLYQAFTLALIERLAPEGGLARVLSSKNPCQIRHRSMDLDRGSLLAGPDLVSAAMRPGQECSWAYEPLRNLAHRACHAVPSANVQYG